MNTSTETDKIALALIEIQNDMTVVKNAEGVHNAKYATLAAILLTVRPFLKANELTIFQSMDTDDKVVTCTTRVMHSSGQWIDSVASVTAGGLSPQLFGGAISYVRRYGISAALSIATPDDDDDAEKIEKAYTKAEEKQAIADDLQKYRGAVLEPMMRYDLEIIELSFANHGYSSIIPRSEGEEDGAYKERILCDLVKMTEKKAQLKNIGLEMRELKNTAPIE